MEKIEIPLDVTNPKEWMKYVILSKHSIFRSPIYEASDGSEINIGMLPHRLSKLIAHLSPAEQDTIMEMKRRFNELLAMKSTAKRQAYASVDTDGKIVPRQRYTALESDVIELYGRLFNPKEVVKILGEDYGVWINQNKAEELFTKHIVEIERRREEFRNKVNDVRLYHKRSRLEELAWMFSKMKNRYITLESDAAYSAMLRTLEQIRKESEGDILNVNGALDVNIDIEINSHIQKEIFKTINLKEIILGRVAARMGFDTKKLVAGLHNSYYAKFSYFSGDYDPNAEISYPSLMNYDFAEIEKLVDPNEVEDVGYEDLTPAQTSAAESAQALFLAKVRKQKEEMEARVKGYDAGAITADRGPKADPEPSFPRPFGRRKDHIIPGGSKAAKEAGGDGKRIKKTAPPTLPKKKK